VRWDRRQRIKADNDMQDLGAPALLDPDVRQAFEAVIASGPMMPDDLTQRARDADAYWSQHVDAIKGSVESSYEKPGQAAAASGGGALRAGRRLGRAAGRVARCGSGR
jgi:uncharacterized protein YcaQ